MKYLKLVVQPFASNLFSQVFQFVHLTKAVLLHAKKAIWWRRDIVSTHFQSRTLPPREGPPVPIVQEAGWAPEPVWTQTLKENFFRFC
jgi:hypothetical protein